MIFPQRKELQLVPCGWDGGFFEATETTETQRRDGMKVRMLWQRLRSDPRRDHGRGNIIRLFGDVRRPLFTRGPSYTPPPITITSPFPSHFHCTSCPQSHFLSPSPHPRHSAYHFHSLSSLPLHPLFPFHSPLILLPSPVFPFPLLLSLPLPCPLHGPRPGHIRVRQYKQSSLSVNRVALLVLADYNI